MSIAYGSITSIGGLTRNKSCQEVRVIPAGSCSGAKCPDSGCDKAADTALPGYGRGQPRQKSGGINVCYNRALVFTTRSDIAMQHTHNNTHRKSSHNLPGTSNVLAKALGLKDDTNQIKLCPGGTGRSDDIDNPPGKVENRFESFEHRLGKIRHRIEGIENRLGKARQRFEKIENKLDKAGYRLENGKIVKKDPADGKKNINTLWKYIQRRGSDKD